jgi:hypothetical protein
MYHLAVNLNRNRPGDVYKPLFTDISTSTKVYCPPQKNDDKRYIRSICVPNELHMIQDPTREER